MLSERNLFLLRWFLVLPGAILIYILATGLIGFLANLNIISSNIDEDSWTVIYILPALVSGASAAAYIYYGAMIAPKANKKIALILLLLLTLYIGFTVFSALILREYKVFVQIISTIVGGLFGYYALEENIKKIK